MAGSTQRVIRKTFMELLEERPLNEITVKLIVERCGINRKTFYNHYRDIPDLMEKILTDEVDAIMVYAGGFHRRVFGPRDRVCLAA